MHRLKFIVIGVCLLAWRSVAEAQYVLVLKNGRQITVQSYREEGSMVKFTGLGGEAAISKDQVQTIRRAGEADRSGASNLTAHQPPSPATTMPPLSQPAEIRPSMPSVSRADDQIAIKREDEEKVYLQKVKEINEQLKQLRDQYALMTRGNRGSEPSFFTTEEAFRGHQEDLLSRLRDAQFRAQGLPSGSNATSPPFSVNAPPAYSEKQKELSDLRHRIGQLENHRERLIDEMKAKNFDTASLLLD